MSINLEMPTEAGLKLLAPDKSHDDVKKPLSNKEELYSLLWADYFKSTNIPARKNMKLHIQHVPKRYWKYLTEKQGKN